MRRSRPAFYRALGERIRFWREDARLSQDRLAIAVGLNRTSICNIEAGKQKVLAHILVDLASVLQIDIRRLLP